MANICRQLWQMKQEDQGGAGTMKKEVKMLVISFE
jgi:hypothetical protein